jgi:hypothetical protein
MEWLLLFLIVPAVVIPVVLLFGFAGCRQILGFEDPVLVVADPQFPRIESIGLNHIRVAWDYLIPPPEPVTFELEINSTDPPGQAIESGITDLFLQHTGLQEGQTFFYRVRAIRGSDQLVSNWVPDPPLSATTLSFETVFETTTNPPNPVAGIAAAGNGIVQRIGGAAITRGGTFVKLTLVGLANQVTQLAAVTISHPVAAGAPQPWDSADPPLPVTFGGGGAAVALQNGVPVVSDIITFPVTQGEDLLIAFDVSATSQNVLRRGVTGTQAYRRNNTAEAATQDRSAGYGTENNLAYCIERIEVAGPEPGPIS